MSELEANSVGCAAPCGSPDYPLPSGGIASGGVVFAWRDEWYMTRLRPGAWHATIHHTAINPLLSRVQRFRVEGNSIGPHNEYCPDWDASRHSVRPPARPPGRPAAHPPARPSRLSPPPPLPSSQACGFANPAFLGGGDKTNDGFMNEEWYATWDAPRTRSVATPNTSSHPALLLRLLQVRVDGRGDAVPAVDESLLRRQSRAGRARSVLGGGSAHAAGGLLDASTDVGGSDGGGGCKGGAAVRRARGAAPRRMGQLHGDGAGAGHVAGGVGVPSNRQPDETARGAGC